MDIRNWATDPKLEVEGVWTDVGGGARLRVARLGNPNFRELSRKLLGPHQHAARRGKLDDEITLRITVQAMAESILLDWEGLHEDGKPLPYSREEAERLLTDYPDFREEVATLSQDVSRFRPPPAPKKPARLRAAS